jgi:hypothetical protein
MEIQKGYPEEGEEEKPKIHQPEFIILDGSDEGPSPSQESKEMGAEYVETLQKIGHMSFGWPIRIMCFSGAIIAALATAFVAVLACVSFLIAGLVLFMMKDANAQMFKVFATVRKLFVLTLGLLIAVFSPPLGLGMIVLYFMLHGERLQQSIFTRTFVGRP